MSDSPFDPARMQKFVDEALAKVPTNKQGAIVGQVDTDLNWHITGAVKTPNGRWVIGGTLQGQGGKNIQGAGEIGFYF